MKRGSEKGVAGVKRAERRRNSGGSRPLILTLLALVAVIGLLGGALTRALSQPSVGAALSRQLGGATNQGNSQATTPAGAATSSGATPTATATTAAQPSAQFNLKITASAHTVAVGDTLTLTVRAFAPDTLAPISGLTIVLRAPSNGAPALLTSWPPAQTTDANGAAIWQVTVPTLPSGTYVVEAYAQTTAWSYRVNSSVTVR